MARLSGTEVKGFELLHFGRPFVKFEVSSLAATSTYNYFHIGGYFLVHLVKF